MKYQKNIFYFLHFIIFSYNTFLSSPRNSFEYLHSPNYYVSNLSNIFHQNYSTPVSITTKEILFSNKTSLSDRYTYFLATSKSGIISLFSNNKELFSIDFKKKMNQTNIEQTNIINEDKVVLAFEGKLFIVKNNLEVQNFEEFTTPISELVDMTPFSLWFMPDYYFLSEKKYSIIRIINNSNNTYKLDIELNLIFFVDYTLICLKDKEQVWNTTITNVYFLNKNEENKMTNKKIKIEELMLLYENNEKLEKNIKSIFGNKLNDILFIHGYDKIKKRYVKIYDFNTFSHIIQNNTVNNNIEEQNHKNKIGEIEYKSNVSEKNDFSNLSIYSIIIVILIIIFLNLIFNFFFPVSELFKKIINNFENKTNNNIFNNININNDKKELNDNNKSCKNKESYEILFKNIQNNFLENEIKNENCINQKERKKTIDLEASLKDLEINSTNKNQIKEKHNQFNLIRNDLNELKIKQANSIKNINEFKKIKKSLNKHSFSSSSKELKEILPKKK